MKFIRFFTKKHINCPSSELIYILYIMKYYVYQCYPLQHVALTCPYALGSTLLAIHSLQRMKISLPGHALYSFGELIFSWELQYSEVWAVHWGRDGCYSHLIDWSGYLEALSCVWQIFLFLRRGEKDDTWFSQLFLPAALVRFTLRPITGVGVNGAGLQLVFKVLISLK